MLNAKRPDIQIVGDELHPLLKITDFAPYIAKIKASGADSVITGNWGQDFALLLKAAADAGLKVNWYTYYAGGTGGPTAIKQANLNHQVFQIAEGIPNLGTSVGRCLRKGAPRQVRLQPVLSARRQRDADVCGRGRQGQVARPGQGRAALEGMKFEVFDGGKGTMRKDDHQFFQPMYIASFGDRTEKEPFDEEKTGWGWQLAAKIDTAADHASDHLQDGAPELDRRLRASFLAPAIAGARSAHLSGVRVVLELIVISTLNGVLFGMLLFLMASGLTVIFSMLGVLNFAHASFYMLGAFFGFQISRWVGFWPALLIAPLLAGAHRRGGRALRPAHVHRNGHVAELLFTFGLAFVIEEIVQIIWGKSPVDFRVPALLDFPAFTIFSTNYPAYKMFMLLVSIAIFVGAAGGAEEARASA